MGRRLEVVLEEPSRRWRGGETVRGEVVVEVDDDTTCKSLDVDLGWSTSGRGNRASDDVASARLFAGTWSRGEHRYAFEFELPRGPYSYEGHHLSVGWRIGARADVPWAFDPKDEVELWLEPAPLAPGHPALERGESFRLEHTHTIPDDAPLSFGVSYNRLYWKIEVVVDVHRWPNLEFSNQLVVGHAWREG